MAERRTVSGWRLDEETGRLYAPGGAFVARIIGGRIVFYDKERRCEVLPGLSVADWFELLFGEHGAQAGAWGRR